MAMFLIAEAVFFLLLVLAFVYFRAMPRSLGPFAWLFTAVIALSSLTMWRASVASSVWVCTTVALGIAFVIGQATVYRGTFFTLVAIHGLHVLAGSIALAFVPASALRAMAIYWYFFTAVWLAIFITASQI
jgi:heme/copper-type cytochrome/quinol oxidase subunit 3